MSSSTLEEKLSISEADPWYPFKSDGAGQPQTIAGELVALDSVWSDYQNDLRIVAVIRDSDGKMWSVRTYPTRLHSEWLKATPQIGETVAVRFTGMLERKKDGRAYPDFAVAVDRETPSVFDYSRMGAEPQGADVAEDEARHQAQADAQAEDVPRPDDDPPF